MISTGWSISPSLSEGHVAKVKDVIKIGDPVEARVIKVDKVERRIGLSIKAANYSEEDLQRETQAFEGTSAKHGYGGSGTGLQSFRVDSRRSC